MDKLLVLHFSDFHLSSTLTTKSTFANFTHMSNFKSELPNADFCSFIYLDKLSFNINTKNFAPWVFSKWASIFVRIPYMLFLFCKYDRVVIYHSKGFYVYFPLFLLFRNKLILQVNEIYSNVNPNKIQMFLEINYIRLFKKLIISNHFLKTRWFPKKNTLLRGGYFRYNYKRKLDKKENNSFIYVGSVNDDKMGNVSILIKLIEKIPDHFSLCLCVLCSDLIYNILVDLSKTKNNVKLKRNVKAEDLNEIYEFYKYGLVLQDPLKPFNSSSFPSKIFSYLNNDVIPIALPTPAFKNSEIAELICFIEEFEWSKLTNIDFDLDNLKLVSNRLKIELQSFVYR